MQIKAKCEHEPSQLFFLSADGYIWPCCYLDPKIEREEFATWLKDNGGEMSDFIYDDNLAKIRARPSWKILRDSFDSYASALSTCKLQCTAGTKRGDDNLKSMISGLNSSTHLRKS